MGDLATKIFLNSKGKSDTLDSDVAAFLRYVDGKADEGVFTKGVNEEVIRVKKHREPRRGYMTYAMELEMTKREVIVNLLKMNLDIDSIAKATDSTISYVKEAGREAVISV